MDVLKLAAFSHNGQGGNPAGVAFYESMPSDEEMLRIAKEVGYSETAFAVKQGSDWRVRYFAPAREVEFCGHATIALGAVLRERFGDGEYRLVLNQGEITARAETSTDRKILATLQSPETWSQEAPKEYVEKILAAFQLKQEDLDPAFPIRLAFGGVRHIIIFVNDRKTLAEMSYPFEEVKTLMDEQGLTTISILWRESDELFHSRNPFASGGVYEDPATGAAAAALAGYLRDIGWKGKGEFVIMQGEDMGAPCRLVVKFDPKLGESVSVSGETRYISDE
ncbi:MAG TPA: PhzF family phenazine biosynthesis protein [Anaerolineales bacterium]|nr:PhzF family phenazine biosynthesis protein [Anaerolineales bacterium]